MDYEKKYKEAMEKFKNFKDKYCTGGDLGFGDIIFDKSGKAQEEFDNIFPELKESKDEKIRKEIINYIKTGTYKKDWIIWLEKQSEEAKNDSQIWQIANNSAKTFEQSFAILNATQKAYNKGRKDALKEQKPEHSYCQEHCQGYKESGGRCYFGFDCEAKREAEQNYMTS